MSNSRTGPIQPRLLIDMSGSHERRCGNLLRVQSKADFARVILALWNGAWDRLGDESGRLHQPVELPCRWQGNIRVTEA